MKELDLDLLQKIPCIVSLPEETLALWKLCFHNVWMPKFPAEWKSSIDSLVEEDRKQTLFLNFSENERRELTEIYGFPMLKLSDVPPINMINELLPEQFETLCSEESDMLKQSAISEEIAKRIAYSLPDIVVLLVFDGLSFYDVVDWQFPESWKIRREPCLVDGLSVTSVSMRRLIGSPCLAHRLFDVGYKQRFGFSYWEREQNILTNELFSEFPSSQLYRVTTFEEILDTLPDSMFERKTFIQIVRTGLDSYCHFHREKTDVAYLLSSLQKSVEQIVTALSHSRKSIRLFMTADHGILWFKEQTVVPVAMENAKPRYFEGSYENISHSCLVTENGRTYTVLAGDNSITRNRRVTEWGFHGGVSAQESLMPLFDIIPNV